MTNRLRDHMKAAAGALLAFAFYAYCLDSEDRIVTGQIIGDTHTLIATAEPCTCTEICE